METELNFTMETELEFIIETKIKSREAMTEARMEECIAWGAVCC